MAFETNNQNSGFKKHQFMGRQYNKQYTKDILAPLDGIYFIIYISMLAGIICTYFFYSICYVRLNAAIIL